MTDARILLGDCNDLFICLTPVNHLHNANYLGRNQTQRHNRHLCEDYDIEWVTVIAQRLRDKSIVQRVIHGSINHTVEFNQTADLVNLIFRPGSPWDLDDAIYERRGLFSYGNF